MLPETREVASQITQAKLSSQRPKDYWTIASQEQFKFSTMWNEIRLQEQKDRTYKLLWYNSTKTAIKFCYTTYMAYMYRLSTSDRLLAWGIDIDSNCNLCSIQIEMHNHLFIECEYSTYLWKALLNKLDLLQTVEISLQHQLQVLRTIFATTLAARQLEYVVAATTINHIWMERVRRRFEGKMCSTEQRGKLIEIDVRLQIQIRVRHRHVSLTYRRKFLRWGFELGDTGDLAATST